jgi:hypothetical protein
VLAGAGGSPPVIPGPTDAELRAHPPCDCSSRSSEQTRVRIVIWEGVGLTRLRRARLR